MAVTPSTAHRYRAVVDPDDTEVATDAEDPRSGVAVGEDAIDSSGMTTIAATATTTTTVARAIRRPSARAG